MGDDTEAGLLRRCVEADPLVNLTLYADFLGTTPDDATLPALALREQARAGRIDPELIPVLAVALVDAPNLAAFSHLAKALAAFGARARMAARLVIDRLRPLQVTTDGDFWALDGGLWVLGHLGGVDARAFVVDLKKERPARVQRSKSVYQGAFDDAERQEVFDASVLGVLALIDAGDAPGWRHKATNLSLVGDAAPAKRLAPWMTR